MLDTTTFETEGACEIIKPLKFNPSLKQLTFHEDACIGEVQDFAVNTQHCQKRLLVMLIGEDGAQVLANMYRMRFPIAIISTTFLGKCTRMIQLSSKFCSYSQFDCPSTPRLLCNSIYNASLHSTKTSYETLYKNFHYTRNHKVEKMNMRPISV
jgi:hypothetical protein